LYGLLRYFVYVGEAQISHSAEGVRAFAKKKEKVGFPTSILYVSGN